MAGPDIDAAIAFAPILQPAAPPAPDAAEIRDNATFAALLAALARPGSVHRMPEPGPAPLALALLDRECRVWAEEGWPGDDALRDVIRRTGAVAAPLGQSGHVFLSLDSAAAATRLAEAAAGDPLYPDAGATIVAPARIGAGPALRLVGPGIETEALLRLGGVHPGVWAARAALCRYPLGIEMIFVDGDRIAAIPRSTRIEEL